MSRLERRTWKMLEHLRVNRGGAEDTFWAESADLGWSRVYGGQTMAQALAAAHATAPDRCVQSFSAYFARPGRVDVPVEYRVERLGDGKSVSTRSVKGYQKSKQIFAFDASLAAPSDEQLEHVRPLFRPEPFAPGPTMQEILAPYADRFPARNEALRKTYLDRDTPIDYRPVDYVMPWDDAVKSPDFAYYFRTKLPVGDDPRTHLGVLAYVSDWSFLATALRPHPISALNAQIVTISHTLYVHDPRNLRVDKDYLYFRCCSPRSRAGRALVVGEYFDRKGTLLATATQEGVIRKSSSSR
ncbi:hypothetical protein CTAYLR_005845 [Chrysophaeum taylorii]|uniref:Acyl-CoA thioesterase II n=1 Tax=Chrysophaeum taylorii TaxID=2483200 RepID=A0AAD7UPJ2_9STRA|nr:hypothetical protein CTAYLR_005845 [Chrysophaeum taylorii]